MEVYLVFSANTPILILSSFEEPDAEGLRQKLSNMGIDKYLLFTVPLAETRSNYEEQFEEIAGALAAEGDLRVLDYNGYSAFQSFSLSYMKLVDKYEG